MQYPWFSQKLLEWYDSHGRHDLPWQKNKTAYRVWVSEIMLQQTQVTTVIDYYTAFMRQFPTLQQLADADTDAVLAAWSGLGYYSRARNLHKTAVLVTEKYGGRFPANIDELINLPGIGRSTACAILSIVHGQSTAILDGNVRRVLSRVFLLEGHPSKKAVEKAFWQLAQSCMPSVRCGDHTQAIMDLGATLCKRSSPNCDVCPFLGDCLAYQKDLIAHYPSKKAKKTRPIKTAIMLLLRDEQGKVLLARRPDNGIWGGLWSLPEFDSTESILQWVVKQRMTVVQELTEIDRFRHSFSHYHLEITAVSLHIKPKRVSQQNGQWYNYRDIAQLGVAAAISKILAKAQESV